MILCARNTCRLKKLIVKLESNSPICTCTPFESVTVNDLLIFQTRFLLFDCVTFETVFGRFMISASSFMFVFALKFY